MIGAKTTGRIVGLLMIVLLATGLIVPYVLLRPMTGAPAGFLDAGARMPLLVRASMLQLFVGAMTALAITIAAWPHVRGRSPGLALWLLVFAASNFVLQLVENSHWLTMMSVSQAYAEAGLDAAARFQPLATTVRAAWRWAHYTHILVVVDWLFLLFLACDRARLAPRALAALGMALCVLHFVGVTLPVFAGYRVPATTLFGMPLGFGILATAAWLLAKGFPEEPAVR